MACSNRRVAASGKNKGRFVGKNYKGKTKIRKVCR